MVGFLLLPTPAIPGCPIWATQLTMESVFIPRFMVLATCTAAVGSMFLTKAAFRQDSPQGIDFVHLNSPTSQKYLIETMGGGVAILDYNNDGLADLFFVNSGQLANRIDAPERFARAEPKFWNRLYRQNRDGSFTDVTKAAGLSAAGDGNYGMGRGRSRL